MIKRLSLFVLVFSVFLSASAQKNTGYDLTFKVNGVKDQYVTLAFYLGDKQYIQDSAKADANGKVVFKDDTKLEPGIYLFVANKNKFFEFLVNRDDQVVNMETDTADMIKNMKVKSNADNKLFYEYLIMLNTKQAQLKPLQDKFKKFSKEGPKDTAEVYRKKLEAIDKEVKDYKNGLMVEQPNTFLAAIFRASWEPETPPAPKGPDGKQLDPDFNYHYFKSHYWDKFDFSDERILRTPIIQSKIRFYLDRLTPQAPDSIMISAKLIGDKAKANKDVFKFTINYITNFYESSKTMGFDAIFVFMAQEYYLPVPSPAYWVDSTQMQKVKERVDILKYLLLGKPALDLNLPDTTGKDIRLSTVQADYTIVFFWDPTCGHCKKETPILVDFYKRAKSKGIKIYAVGSGGTKEEWKKMIRDFKMDFVNVYDELGYRKFYDIYATPVIYLLDKNKTIKAKRLDVPQLEDFMRDQYKITLPQSTVKPAKEEPESH